MTPFRPKLTTRRISGHEVTRHEGTLLILGSGHTLWDDLKRSPQTCDRLAVNEAGWVCNDSLQHWTTLHPTAFYDWAPKRADKPILHISCGTLQLPNPICTWEGFDLNGTSAMFAVRIALFMGYDKIVLAGIPMDAGGYVPEVNRYPAHDGFVQSGVRDIWKIAAQTVFFGKVSSLSGWTKELLGEPK